MAKKLEIELQSEEVVRKTKWQKAILFVKGNYKNLAAVLCLWVGFFLCNVAYSLLAPFFPQEVAAVEHFGPKLASS